MPLLSSSMAQNLKDKLKETVARFPKHSIIQYKKDDRWVSIRYDDFARQVESLSAFLKYQGIEKNDKVAILLENRWEWPLVFFATVSLGAVCVPLNPDSNEKEIENFIKNAECKIAFASDGSLFKKITAVSCPSLKKIISVDSDEFKNISEDKKSSLNADSRESNADSRISNLRSSALDLRRSAFKDDSFNISSDDLACLLYTSGTTDEPKGVMLTHQNLLSNVESIQKLGLVTYKDRAFCVLPLHHTYALTGTMLLPILCGGKIIYPGTLRPDSLLMAMQETHPTFFLAVPQLFYLFYQNINQGLKNIRPSLGVFLSGLIQFFYALRRKTGINLTRFLLFGVHRKFGGAIRLFVSGGAKLSVETEEGLMRLGFTILEGYGLTETSPVLTLSPLKRPKIGSVGLPVPNVELQIRKPDQNGVGEVLARGPNVMQGYYRRQDLTEQVIREGWFYTGDLGYIDEDGYLFLTGRAKEVIVLSTGVNVYPEEIEVEYLKHAPVKEMCIFEIPAKKGLKESMVLWAVVVPDLEYFKKHGEVNLKSVIKERFDNISRTLPRYKRLMGFSITLEPLPRTLLGKIKRFAVKATYLSTIIQESEEALSPKELSQEDAALLELEPTKKILQFLKEQAKVDKPVLLGDLLELDLGIDSLGRIELASGLEKMFNMQISDEMIGNVFCVRDIVVGMVGLIKEGPAAPKGAKEGAGARPDYWKRLLDVPPSQENLDKIDLKPGAGAWLFGFFLIWFVFIFFKLFYRFKVEGKENLPDKEPCIIFANHTSFFDGFLVAAAMPRRPMLNLFFLGFRPYFNVPIVRNLVKIGRIIPLDFSGHLMESLRSCYYILKNDKILCLFPEGLRTLDGEIVEFKKGFGILAKESGARLVPIFLDGAHQAWPRTAKYPKCHPITVRIGKPLTVEELEKSPAVKMAKDSYEAICLATRAALIHLKEIHIS